MSRKWERSFEIAVPVERVWRAFTDPDEIRLLLGPPADAVDAPVHDPSETIRVIEAEPLRLLRWAQERPDLPEKAEFTVVFESREGGSRITVTRAGFGEDEVSEIFSESNGLGWEHGFMDLVLYLETGQHVNRHYDGCSLSSLGVMYAETDSGIEVRSVKPGCFGAEAGLERGDRLVRLGDAPVYTRSDIWQINERRAPGTELEVQFVRGRELMTGRGKLSPLQSRAVGE